VFEEGRRFMGSVVKRLCSVAWRKTAGLSVVSVLVVSVIAIAEIGVLNDATVVAAPAAAPECAAGYGAAGVTGTTQSATVGGHGCVVIEYLVGGVKYFETFNYTGANQTWTVPAGVTAAKFTTYGAGGGGTNTGPVRTNTENADSWYTDASISASSRHNGGAGGFATAAFTVTPGENLTVLVGQGGIGNPDARCLPVVTMIPETPWEDIAPRDTDNNKARESFGGGALAKTHFNARSLWEFPLTQDVPERDNDECRNPYYASGGGRSEVVRAGPPLVAAGGGGGAGFYGKGGDGAALTPGGSAAAGINGEGPDSCCTHVTLVSVGPSYGSGGTTTAGGTGGKTSQPTDLWTRVHWWDQVDDDGFPLEDGDGNPVGNRVISFFGSLLPRVNGLEGTSNFGGASLEGGGGGGGGCFGGGGGGDGGGGGGGSSCVAANQIAPPTASSEVQSVVPGGSVVFTTLTGSGGLAASSAGFDTASTCLVDPATTTCSSTFTVAGEGTYTLNATTGVVTFVAAADATAGAQTPITYQVTDVVGQTASSTLTVVIPPPPVAVNDVSSGAYNTDQVIAVLANDSATAPATLDASSVKLCPSSTATVSTCTLTSLTVDGEGTYTVNADGTVTFVPLSTFTGVATSVGYVVADSTGQLASATITATVDMPAAPTASSEVQSVVPGGSVVFTTLTGSGGLAASSAGFDTASTCLFNPGTTTCNATGVIVIAGEGTYTLNATTGVVTFVADPNATEGAQTPITYQVTDSFGQTQTATLTATVVFPPPPVAVSDEPSGAHNTVQVIAVLANDSATSPAALDASSVRLCASSTETDVTQCTLTSLTVAGEGTYTVNADGTVTFVPEATFTGVATSVRYVVADSVGQLASATITATVNEAVVPGVPEVPDASADSRSAMVVDLEPSGAFGAVQVIVVVSNDSASSPPALDASTLRLCASSTETDFSLCSLMSLTVDGEGTYTVNADGTVTFVPNASFVGVASSVRYVVADSDGLFASARITLTVHAPNLPADEATQSSDGSVLPSAGTEPWEFILLGMLLAALGLLTLSGDLRTGRPRRASLGNGRS
jgi:CshA-type fibril repeat protein